MATGRRRASRSISDSPSKLSRRLSGIARTGLALNDRGGQAGRHGRCIARPTDVWKSAMKSLSLLAAGLIVLSAASPAFADGRNRRPPISAPTPPPLRIPPPTPPSPPPVVLPPTPIKAGPSPITLPSDFGTGGVGIDINGGAGGGSRVIVISGSSARAQASAVSFAYASATAISFGGGKGHGGGKSGGCGCK